MAESKMTPQQYRQAVNIATHRRLYEGLIRKVREDRFPSATMMNMIEEGAWPDEIAAYVEALMDKVDSERFPSPDMLKRIARVSG